MSKLYAIVDASRDERIYDLVHDALFPMCLFRTDIRSPLARAAPYLVPVEHAEKLMALWRSEGVGKGWGLLLRSNEEQARLRQKLRTFNQAKLPDGRVVLFRWWDPRVFRVYIGTCDAAELAPWFAGVEEWVCEEGEGGAFAAFRNSERGVSPRAVEAGVIWGASALARSPKSNMGRVR